MNPREVDDVRSSRTFHASAYSPALRLLAAVCFAASRASLPAIAVLGFVLAEQTPEPRDLVKIVGVTVAIPGFVAWLLARAGVVRVALEDERIVMDGWRRIEVPTASLVGLEPWTLPLPAPGFWLRLTSGRRLRWGLAMADPASFVGALTGIVDPGVCTHPMMIYAAEKARRSPGRLGHPLVKFLLFGLGPTAIVFNADQYITYGGTFGQYYLEGALPYLRHFVIDWALVAVYLVLYASLWRTGAELASSAAALLAPSSAGKVRTMAEYACLVGFYGGVPAMLAMRFLS